MRILKVSEAAREIGRSEAWLRRAERNGRIPEARRDLNGWRFYTLEDIVVLRRLVLPGASNERDEIVRDRALPAYSGIER